MEFYDFMKQASSLPGEPGYEAGVNGFFAECFRPLADEVWTDTLENMIARRGDKGPKIMISAHQDEVGLLVTRIEDDGCLRFTRNGGVDPRIMPGAEVIVRAKGGDLFGVVGAKPPHLLSAADRKKALMFDDLYIDVGYPVDQVKRLVRVGDMVTLKMEPVRLMNDVVAGKTMDDRASVYAMLETARTLSRMNTEAQVYYVASSQEEVGSKGAMTAAWSIHPDLAIAIDVTFGKDPGAGKWETFPLDKVVLAVGPNIHPMLGKKLQDVAKKYHIAFAQEVTNGPTGTDASEIQVTRGGIPCVLVSIPLKYMHTTVETIKTGTVTEAGRLMAMFIDEISREWEDLKWY